MNEIPRIVPKSVDPTNNTYSLIIRNNIYTLVQAMPYFANFKRFGTSRQFPIKLENIPYCGVYLVNDAGGPDGNINHGMPRFSVSARIGFSVWIANNDPIATENQLDGAFRAIMRGILENKTIYGDPVAQVEGFSGFTRAHYYGNTTLDNESPIAEMRAELVCFYREDYRYVATDDFKSMKFTTAWPSPDEASNVQQIEAIWDLPQ